MGRCCGSRVASERPSVSRSTGCGELDGVSTASGIASTTRHTRFMSLTSITGGTRTGAEPSAGHTMGDRVGEPVGRAGGVPEKEAWFGELELDEQRPAGGVGDEIDPGV